MHLYLYEYLERFYGSPDLSQRPTALSAGARAIRLSQRALQRIRDADGGINADDVACDRDLLYGAALFYPRCNADRDEGLMATAQIEATLKQGVVINLYARYYQPRFCALIV